MPDTSIYGKLKKLFATGTIVRNVGGKKLKVVDTDNIQGFINRRLVDRYHRFYSTQTGGYGSSQGRYESAAAFHGSRQQLFRDYDMMDADPIISSVMDIYADESTVKDEFGQILSIHSKDHDVQEILHNLFYDILNVEHFLWPWIRNLCKYGDFFLYLNIHPEYGVVNVIPLSVSETMRIEGEDPSKPFEVKFKLANDYLNIGKVDFDSYEIAHFRMLSDTNFLPYGKSMVENGRRVWKQLQLMEDAMLIHRIIRASDKRKITIDVGNMPPNEIDQYMQKIINQMKRTPLINPKTGDYDLRYSIMNITEDIWLPTRGKDSGTNIETLPGLTFNAIEDIEYLRNKLMASFKVPKAFYGYEEDLSGKATLAAQDVRFARTIERIQRTVVSELTKIAITHLYVQGYRDEKLLDFTLSMSSPSTIHEQEKIALWKEKISLCNEIAQSRFLSREWIYNNILEISDEDMEEEKKKVEKDIEMLAKLSKMEQDIMQSQPEGMSGQEGQPASPDGGEGVPAEQPADDVGGVEAGENPDGSPTEEEIPPPAEEISDEEAESELEAKLDELIPDDEEEEEDQLAEQRRKLKGFYDRKKVGRPKKGYRIKHDGHYLGRDPLGAKENKKALREIPLRFAGFIKSLELLDEKKEFKQLMSD
jgi:hypothetical protein